ncbi:MAG: 50S ribosomal protein L30 [Armatimonadetes bacterium]|nr:50S ribosomal protein L30 [Armatimonadota bacterium]
MPKALKITLSKSLIGQVPKNVKTAHALGLRKIGQSTINHPTSAVKGMVHQVKHVLTVEEIDVEGEIPRKRRGHKAKAAAAAAPKAEKKAVKAKAEPVAAAPAAEEAAPAPKKPAAKKPTTKKKTEE